MRRNLLLASLIALPAFACGSSPATVNPLEVDLAGSYELTVGDVTQTTVSNQVPKPVGTTSPSTGHRFRLDLRRSGSTYDAVITPEFGGPAPMTAAVPDGSLVLTGESTLSGSSNDGNMNHRWLTLVVPVGADGLGANVSLKGQESVFQGDVGWMYDVTSTAGVVRDKRPPSFKLTASGSAAGKYLPWDRLTVFSSEPVAPEKLALGIQASVASTYAVFTSKNFGASTDASVEWAGRVLLEGTFDDANVPGGDGFVAIEPGIVDLAGNAGSPTTEPTKLPFTMIELGAPQVEIDFDGKDAMAPAMWGSAATVSGAECEANASCLKLGTFAQTICSDSTDGLAARLTGSGSKTLAFRYRVNVAVKYGGGASSFDKSQILKIDLARSGAALRTENVPVPKLQNVGTEEMPVFDSQWIDGAVTLPAGGSTVAFAIRPASLSPYGCYGPALPPVDVTIWVDSLRLE
ncbi:hypothetical protein BH09MYX1_BH09MYX1_52560 [soil metagenome]